MDRYVVQVTAVDRRQRKSDGRFNIAIRLIAEAVRHADALHRNLQILRFHGDLRRLQGDQPARGKRHHRIVRPGTELDDERYQEDAAHAAVYRSTGPVESRTTNSGSITIS